MLALIGMSRFGSGRCMPQSGGNGRATAAKAHPSSPAESPAQSPTKSAHCRPRAAPQTGESGLRLRMKIRTALAQYSPIARWFMAVVWLLIALKCALVWWAINAWHVPFHPLWIVIPTVVFATLATGLWLTHHEE